MEGLVDMRSAFWKNKKVLITGYEGFLGSNLTRTLLDYGAKIYGLDILTHRKYTILSQEEFNRVNVIRGNVENLPLLTKITKEKKVEFIFHLAARAIVGDCLRKPVRAFSTNIKGTWNILEVARNCGSQIKSVIVASSDKAYGSNAKLPYTEDTPASGSHPYDVSKSCADLIARTYYHTYKLPVAVTRCGNIYGPGDFNFSRIVPDVIRSAINNRTLIIRSDGKFTRDYIYVDDVISGYLGIAEKMQSSNLSGEAFNFSNEKPISVLELVKTIYEIAGKKPDYKILNQAKYEIRHQYLRSSKAKKVIGWKPQYDLQQGLKKTIEWYEAYCNHEDS